MNYSKSTEDIDPKDLQNLAEEFRGTETYLKTVERAQLLDGLDIESVRNLCNAAWELLEAINDHQKHTLIQTAIESCRQAGYEALKLGIIQKIEAIDRFQDEFKKDAITPIITDWFDICTKADMISEKLFNNPTSDTQTLYSEAIGTYKELSDITLRLQSGGEEIRKSARERRLSTHNLFIGWITALIVNAIKSWALYHPKP